MPLLKQASFPTKHKTVYTYNFSTFKNYVLIGRCSQVAREIVVDIKRHHTKQEN